MARQKGRQVRVEIAATFKAPIDVTAITRAKPPVASAASHNLPAGAVGYFRDVGGMVELEGKAQAIASVAAGTFTLQRADTTSYAPFTGGKFVAVETWLTLSQATGYEISGGGADSDDVTTLLDSERQTENGMPAAQSVTISGFADATEAASQKLEDDVEAGEFSIFRITFKNGERRVFRGQASTPGESMAVGATATGSFTVNVKGRVLRLAALGAPA